MGRPLHWYIVLFPLVCSASSIWLGWLLHGAWLMSPSARCSWPTREAKEEGGAKPNRPAEETHNRANLHVLLVSDLHLLGRRGSMLDKTIREWQLHATFQALVSVLRPDAVVVLGDLFDDGSYCGRHEWERHVATFRRMTRTPEGMPLEVVVGNHDVGDGMGGRLCHWPSQPPHPLARFEAEFGRSTRVFMLRNVTFVALNGMAYGCFRQRQNRLRHPRDIKHSHEHHLHGQEEGIRVETGGSSQVRGENSLETRMGVKTLFTTNDSFSLWAGFVADAAFGMFAPSNVRVDSSAHPVLLTHLPLFRDDGGPCGEGEGRGRPAGAQDTQEMRSGCIKAPRGCSVGMSRAACPGTKATGVTRARRTRVSWMCCQAPVLQTSWPRFSPGVCVCVCVCLGERGGGREYRRWVVNQLVQSVLMICFALHVLMLGGASELDMCLRGGLMGCL
eukprot:jgi/Mesvir1/16956/Mv15806-RA.2